MSPEVAVGKKFPDFSFEDQRGESVQLSSALKEAERTVLTLYRGFW